DVCLRFSLVASSAIFDHAAKPLGKLLVRRDLAGRSAQIQMRMCIRQSRQNRGVAQVIISRVCAVWFDGGDAVVGDGDDAALQRRGIDGENPAGGEGPFVSAPSDYHNALACCFALPGDFADAKQQARALNTQMGSLTLEP